MAEYQYKYQDLLDYVAQRLTIVNFIYKERGASLKEQVEQMTEDLKEQLEDVGISLDSNEDIDGDADDHLGEDYELKAKLRRMKVSESEIQHEMKKLDSELDELISGGKTENIIVIQDIEEQVLKIEKKNPPPVYNFTSMQHMTFKRALRIRYNFNIKMKIKA